MRGWWLWVFLLAGCASTPMPRTSSPTQEWAEAEEARECEDRDEDQCLAQVCEDDVCALFRCEDLAPNRVVRTRGATAAVPVFVAPGSGPQRNWGSAQGLPGDAVPVMVFRWHPREKLPSELRRQKAMQEWAKRPKERHHIFPQAFKEDFARKGISIHQYVLAIDAELHARIHKGEKGGPWNNDWDVFLKTRGEKADIHGYFEHASWMIQKYDLFGLTMTYWQQMDLMPMPVED